MPPRSQIRRTNTHRAHVELIETQAVERIAELPEHFRLAITMHELIGLSHREIAEQTGQTEGAVRDHLYRGLARLGQRVAGD